MSSTKTLTALAVVLVAGVVVAWLFLRTGDPTSFASGTRVELAAFKGANPTGVPPRPLPVPISLPAANI